MAEPFRVTVYPGCTVEVYDTSAFARNPLRQNPLVSIKDDPAHPDFFFADAHVATEDTNELALIDVCVCCHPYAYGPLCAKHRAEVAS